jgi:hypothetical protein
MVEHPHAERERHVIATRRLKEVEPAAETVAHERNGNGTGADMRSVLSLAIFAIWALGFVAFVIRVSPMPIIATSSPGEQGEVQRCVRLFGCPKGQPQSLKFRER